MKFQLKKTYYPQDTYEFNLPAGHSCPFAKACKTKVDRYTGKFSKLGTEFSCYAAESERFPLVREYRWKNYDAVLKGEEIILPKKAKFVRIHGSGDFFSQAYFDIWLKICEENPDVKFWTYTKSIEFLVNRIDKIPKNLKIIASYGSSQDHLIEKYNLVSAKVFNSLSDFILSGLPLDDDDALAMSGEQNFALLNNKINFNLTKEEINFYKNRNIKSKFLNDSQKLYKIKILSNSFHLKKNHEVVT